MSGMNALGGLSQGTMRQFQPPSFDSLDTNSDGGITLSELESNAPGGASDAQSQARAEDLFSKMDSNGDGTVTSDEKDAFDAKMKDRMAQMQFSVQLMASASPATGSSSAASDAFNTLDSDGSGAISLDELSSSDAAKNIGSDALQDLFSNMDSNNDGSVSQDELSSFLSENQPSGPPQGAGGPPPPPPPPSGSDTQGQDNQDSQTASVSLDALTSALNAYSSSGSVDASSLTSSILDLLGQAA